MAGKGNGVTDPRLSELDDRFWAWRMEDPLSLLMCAVITSPTCWTSDLSRALPIEACLQLCGSHRGNNRDLCVVALDVVCVLLGMYSHPSALVI